MPAFKKLKVFTFAKFQAFLFGLLGLVAGVLYAFGGLVIDTLVTFDWMTSNETPGLSYGTLLAFIALFGMPLIFAVLGFITGLIEALIYNTVSSRFPIISSEFIDNVQ
jgi:hypothetical protein